MSSDTGKTVGGGDRVVPISSGKTLTVLALAAVLAVSCCFLIDHADGSAAEGETSGSCGADLAWSYDSSTGALTITGSGSMTDFSYSDTRWGGNEIKSVSLPDGLTSIGSNAFSGCTSLTSVTIGNSVTSIGNYAFSGCTSLTSVTIGNSVTSIRGGAFSGCTSLTSVTIPDSVTSIGFSAFSGCTSLTSVTIGNSVEYIGDYAFNGCTSLTSVTIGNSVTSIGNYAFSGCTSLTSVTIGNSVEYIGDYAFSGCTSLESVTIGNSVEYIGDYAFNGCTSLTSVTIVAGDGTAVFGHDDAVGLTSSTLTIGIADTSGFSDVLKEKIGDRPVFSIDFGDNKEFNGEVKVTLPYALREGESAEGVYVAYVDRDNGELVDIKGTYSDGKVTFGTKHFSDFAVMNSEAGTEPGSSGGSTAIYAAAGIAAAAVVLILVLYFMHLGPFSRKG